MNIKVLQTLAGEFLCELVNEKELVYKNVIMFIPTENGMAPVPANILSEKNTEFKLNRSVLVCEPYTPNEQCINLYKKAFGGIVEVKQNLILPS